MKANVKKLFSAVVAFLMVFSLMIPVAASNKVDVKDNPEIDPNITHGTITVNKKGSTFNIYKLLDAKAKKGQKVFNYSVNPSFEGLIVEKEDKDNKLTYSFKEIGAMPNQLHVIDKETGKVTDPITEATSDFTTAIQNHIDKNGVKPVETIVCDTNTVSKSLEIGFYLVVEVGTSNEEATVASKSMLVPLPVIESKDNGYAWNYNIHVTPKDEEVTVDKAILGEDGEKENISTNNVGDILTYVVDSTIPYYDASTYKPAVKYILTDELSKGLDFTKIKEDVEIKADGKLLTEGKLVKGTYEYTDPSSDGTKKTTETYKVEGGQYAVSYLENNEKEKDKIMQIVFDYEQLANSKYQKIELKYKVKINSNAVIGIDGNPNKVTLTYTTNNKTWTENAPKDETVTYVHGIKIKKAAIFGDDDKLEQSEELNGAKFQLVDSKGLAVATCTFDQTGKLVLNSEEGKTAVVANDPINANNPSVAYMIGFKAGTYTLKEIEAPNGYILPEEGSKLVVKEELDETGKKLKNVKYTLTVNDKDIELPIEKINDKEVADGSVGVATIVNEKGFVLPQTGGAGTWMFTIGGILVMASMLGVFVKLRKKEN